MVNENLINLVNNNKQVELVQELKDYEIKKSPLSPTARNKVIRKWGSDYVSERSKEGYGPCIKNGRANYDNCPCSSEELDRQLKIIRNINEARLKISINRTFYYRCVSSLGPSRLTRIGNLISPFFDNYETIQYWIDWNSSLPSGVDTIKDSSIRRKNGTETWGLIIRSIEDAREILDMLSNRQIKIMTNWVTTSEEDTPRLSLINSLRSSIEKYERGDDVNVSSFKF